jgi:hypothetical protein
MKQHIRIVLGYLNGWVIAQGIYNLLRKTYMKPTYAAKELATQIADELESRRRSDITHQDEFAFADAIWRALQDPKAGGPGVPGATQMYINREDLRGALIIAVDAR